MIYIFLLILLLSKSTTTLRNKADQTNVEPVELNFTNGGRYNLSIFENSIGRRSVAVTHEDIMVGVPLPKGYNHINYRIIDGDKRFTALARKIGNFAFLIVEHKGSDVLNREFQSEIVLRIQAISKRKRSSNNNILEAEAVVCLKILDENDNSPMFRESSYFAEIDTQTPLNSKILKLEAFDADEGLNGAIYFSLTSPSPYFYIEPLTGWVRNFAPINLPGNHTLDFRIEDRASRISKETNNQLPLFLRNTAKAVIQVNEHERIRPLIKFEPYDFEPFHTSPQLAGLLLLDESSSSSFVLDIAQLDPISKCSWITRVNKTHFELWLCPFAPPSNIPLVISALVYSTTGVSGKQIVSEHRLNLKPNTMRRKLWFSNPSNRIFINESSPVGTVLWQFVAETTYSQEAEKIQYRLIHRPKFFPFLLNPHNGQLMLNNELDFEDSAQPKSYNITIMALIEAKGDLPQVESEALQAIIEVADSNDNCPIFHNIPQSGIIRLRPENFTPKTPMDRSVYRINATDLDNGKNGEIYYKLFGLDNSEEFFDIDLKSGEIQLSSRQLNTGVQKIWHVRIVAVDGGWPFPNQAEIRLTLLGPDEKHTKSTEKLYSSSCQIRNENPPLVDIAATKSRIFATISEDERVQTRIGQVKAKDPDLGYNGLVQYTILSDTFFGVELQTGKIFIRSDLSKLTQQRLISSSAIKFSDYYDYPITITAWDMAYKNRGYSNFTIMIRIRGSNVNSPIFEHSEFGSGGYRLQIPEGNVVGMQLLRVRATDKDIGPNGQVEYGLATHTEFISVDSSSGIVKVERNFVVKSQNNDGYTEFIEPPVKSMHFIVMAFDRGTPARMTFANLTIDLPESEPLQCVQEVHSFSIADDSPNGQLIGCIGVKNRGGKGGLTYNIRSDKLPLRIDNSSGCLFIDSSEGLDSQKQLLYNFSVNVEKRALRVIVCDVRINIVGVNRNKLPPQFADVAFEATIDENARLDTVVTTVRAEDPEGTRINYQIVAGSGMSFFRVEHDGTIKLSVAELDYEETQFYWLTIRADDSPSNRKYALYSHAHVLVKVQNQNDWAPSFTQPIYFANVEENSPEGKVVLKVEAVDKDFANVRGNDKSLKYSLTKGNPEQFFAINEETGFIVTGRKQLDRETQKEHELEVTACDYGTPQLCSVVLVVVSVVDMNDNEPKFQMNTDSVLKVPGNKTGFICRIFANDLDAPGPNSNIHYRLDVDAPSYLSIDKFGRIFTTKALRPKQSIQFGVVAHDEGQPSQTGNATIRISAIDDKKVWHRSNRRPELLRTKEWKELHVADTDPAGKVLGQVHAVDFDGDLLWWSLPDVVDDDDRDKIFSFLENGELIMTRTLPGTSLANSSEFWLRFSVSDGVEEITDKILVKISHSPDIRPHFASQTMYVELPSDVPSGLTLLRVNATFDRNLGVGLSHVPELRYAIHYVDDITFKEMLQIDDTNGLLTVNYKDRFSRPKHPITIVISAKVVGAKENFQMVSVHPIQAITSSPVFNRQNSNACQYTFIVDRDVQPIKRDIGKVEAFSQGSFGDNEIIYSIIAGNELNLFRIDNMSGVLSLNYAMPHHMEVHNLTIKAENPSSYHLPAVCIASIRLYSREFVPKEYFLTLKVDDTTLPGFTLAFLNSTDTIEIPSLSTFELTGKEKLCGEYLAVQFSTGRLYLKKFLTSSEKITMNCTIVENKTLSNENGDLESIVVQRIYLFLEVIPHSMNLLYFEKPELRGIIKENAKAQTYVLELDDNNMDSKTVLSSSKLLIPSLFVPNSETTKYQINFTILSPRERYFEIDQNSGAIRNVFPLDYETIKYWQISIIAHATETISQISKFTQTMVITIEVRDENDCFPTFSTDDYFFYLTLPTVDGTLLGSVKAVDNDSIGNIRYVVAKSEPDLPIFNVDAEHGSIFLNTNSNKTLYSQLIHATHFELMIMATDGIHSAYINIHVKIIGNDSSPPLDSKILRPLTFAIRENALKEVGQPMLLIWSENFQIGQFVEFELLGADARFNVDSSGILTITRTLDREEQAQIRLAILCQMHDDHSKKYILFVTVTVEDVNDNAPNFEQSHYKLTIGENARLGDKFIIKAKDRDAGMNALVRYSFDKRVPAFLGLDKYDGHISITSAIPEIGSNYQFTVLATDRGLPPLESKMEVYLEIVSKNSPIFDQQHYQVNLSDSILPRTVIASFLAKTTGNENETRIGYLIADGDFYRHFSIDFEKGTLKVNRRLDYELKSSYNITIQAINLEHLDYATNTSIYINVLTSIKVIPHFKKSIFAIKIPEDIPTGSLIGLIETTNFDAVLNNSFIFSMTTTTASVISIDPQGGEIELIAPLNYQRCNFYEFELGLRNNLRNNNSGDEDSFFDRAILQISVMDVNDNKPRFVNPPNELRILLSDLKMQQQFLHQFQVEDADTVANLGAPDQRFRFFIHQTNPPKYATAFNLNPITGVLMGDIKELLLLDNTESHNLGIELEVGVEDGLHQAYHNARIYLILAMHTSFLHFEQTIYEMSLSETRRQRDIIGSIQVCGGSTNSQMKYYTLPPEASWPIAVDESSGKLILNSELDYEKTNRYWIPIMANDSMGRNAFSLVQISVVDENDNSPVWIAPNDGYSLSLDIFESSGNKIAQVLSLDQDVNDKLEYTFLSSSSIDFTKFLEINSEGTISVVHNANLSSKINLEQTFNIRVSDSGNPPHHAEVPFKLTILKNSNNMFKSIPRFSKSHYFFAISENASIGQAIGTLRPMETNVGQQQQNMRYLLASTEVDGRHLPFNLQQHSGILSLSGPLDCEDRAIYNFAVQISNDDSKELSSHAFVTITVVDINDNTPEFKATLEKIAVYEDAPIGSIIGIFLATDSDFSLKNSRIYYSLEGENSEAELPFSIDRDYGLLRLEKLLDREMQAHYVLDIIAANSDGLNSSQKINIEIKDVNDCPPQFHQTGRETPPHDDEPAKFSLEIQAEYTLPNSPLFKFNIMDSDEVNSFVDGRKNTALYILNDPQNIFDINLKNELLLQKITSSILKHHRFDVHIVAFDGLHSSHAFIHIEFINPERYKQKGAFNDAYFDCTTTFPGESIRIPSNLQYGQSIYYFKQNQLPFIPFYRLENSNNLPFKLKNNSELVVSDGFQDKLLYHLKFLIRRGRINQREPLQQEDCSLYLPSCYKKIDVTIENTNRMAPTFSSNLTTLTIQEGTHSNFLGRFFARDDDFGDFGKVVYELIEPHQIKTTDLNVTTTLDITKKFFAVNPATGILTLQQALDRETHSSFLLIVRGTDGGGLNGHVTVVINIEDINDNAPICHPMEVKLLENEQKDASILMVQADDPDHYHNGKITYKLFPGPYSELFSITIDGELRQRGGLDYERVHEFELTVEAMDLGEPPKSSNCSIHVEVLDVNDNNPVFEQKIYAANVTENASAGTRVVKVLATDADSEHFGMVSYAITSTHINSNEVGEGHLPPYFRIDKSGWLTVSELGIDFEKIQEIHITIRAFDGGTPPLFDEANVVVSILDENDNDPQFVTCNMTTVVQEGAKPGQALLTASITDADVTDQDGPFQIELSGSGSTAFAFDPLLNLITTQQLAFSERKEFQLEARAFDKRGRHSSFCPLKIFVQPQSRHPPEVEPLQIHINILFGEFLGGPIGKISAKDLDPRDMLRYSIVEGLAGNLAHTWQRPTNARFTIDAASGDVFGRADILPGLYRLNVSVTDGKFTSFAKLTIDISNIDQDALDNSISISFTRIKAEKFVRIYMRRFEELLGQLIGVRTENIRILSIASKNDEDVSYTRDNTNRISKKERKRRAHNLRQRTSRALQLKTRIGREGQEALNFTQAQSGISHTSHPPSIDVLFTVLRTEQHGQRGYHRPSYVRQKIDVGLSQLIADLPGLEIASITSEVCRSDTCVRADCIDRLWLDNSQMLVVQTPGFSFISPRHIRTFECLCRSGYSGTYCDVPINKCSKELCMKNEICIPSDQQTIGFSCVCPPGFKGERCSQATCSDLGQCSQDESISLLGNGYFQMQVATSLESRMDLGLTFKTVSTDAIIMHGKELNDFHYIIIVNGFIQYRWNCGTGEASVGISSVRVDDGQWHRLKVIRLQSQTRVVLDDKYRSEETSPAGSDVINLYGHATMLTFGAHLTKKNELAKSSILFGNAPLLTNRPYHQAEGIREIADEFEVNIAAGFVGCFGKITIDGISVPKTSQGLRLYNAIIGCDSAAMSPCLQAPCRNGGQCIPPNKLSDDEASDVPSPHPFICKCLSRYTGVQCEIDLNACLDNPCPTGIQCHNLYNDFHCSCPPGFTGKTCQMRGEWDPCLTNPCVHGDCLRSFSSQKVQNLHQFICNCTEGWDGQFCTERIAESDRETSFLSSSQYLAIFCFLLITIISTFMIILCYQRKRSDRRNSNFNSGRKSKTWSSKFRRQQKIAGDGTIRDDDTVCNPLVPKQIPTPCMGTLSNANAPPLPPKNFRQRRNMSSGMTGLPTVQVRPMISSAVVSPSTDTNNSEVSKMQNGSNGNADFSPSLKSNSSNRKRHSHHKRSIATPNHTRDENSSIIDANNGNSSVGSRQSRQEILNDNNAKLCAFRHKIFHGVNYDPVPGPSSIIPENSDATGRARIGSPVQARTEANCEIDQNTSNSEEAMQNLKEYRQNGNITQAQNISSVTESISSDYLTMKPVHRAKPFLLSTPEKKIMENDDVQLNELPELPKHRRPPSKFK